MADRREMAAEIARWLGQDGGHLKVEITPEWLVSLDAEGFSTRLRIPPEDRTPEGLRRRLSALFPWAPAGPR